MTQCQNIGNLVHLTDLHIDLDYKIGSPTTCLFGSSGLGCCREFDIPDRIPYNHSRPWGEYTCDAPISLLHGILKWISNYSNIDAILYGGDTVGHHDITQSTDQNMNTIKTVSNLFKTYFPNISVISNQGNHDTYPIDQTLPWNTNYITNELINDWSSLIIPQDSTLNSLINTTYYRWVSPLKSPNLEIISINSLFYDSNNKFQSNELKENQQIWLQNILEEKRKYNMNNINKKFVYILGHIPPKGGEASNEYNSWLISILTNYSDIIPASFYGHTHKDQLYIYNLNSSSALVSPSIMPDDRDPCFRIYQYDRNIGTLL